MHSNFSTGHDPKDLTSKCTHDNVASFMLAVVPGAFLGCNGWDAQNFGKPLGTPLEPMQVGEMVACILQ